jgi:hypothetical protein
VEEIVSGEELDVVVPRKNVAAESRPHLEHRESLQQRTKRKVMIVVNGIVIIEAVPADHVSCAGQKSDTPAEC